MTLRYYYSGASGSADGSSWTNAYTTITTALAAAAAGDTIYVAHDNNEQTSGSITLTSAGTIASPVNIVCVNRAGSVPPVAADLRTSGVIATTGNSTISQGGGYAYVYGVKIQSGNSTNVGSITLGNNASAGWMFEQCQLALNGTGGSARLQLGATSSANSPNGKLVLKDCQWSFASTSQGVTLATVNLEVFGNNYSGTPGTANLAGTIPTVLFLNSDTFVGNFYFHDLEWSAAGSGKTIFGQLTRPQRITCERIDLNSSVTLTATQAASSGVVIDVINCGSSANVTSGAPTRNERHAYAGDLTTDISTYVTGGASDGTNPFSHKIITSANCSEYFPFESLPMGEFFAGTTGSPISQTFHITSSVTLTNAQAWIEVDYLNSASVPLGSYVTTQAGFLASATGLSSDGGTTWTNASTYNYYITVTWTPQLVGWYRAVFKVGVASVSGGIWISPPWTKAA